MTEGTGRGDLGDGENPDQSYDDDRSDESNSNSFKVQNESPEYSLQVMWNAAKDLCGFCHFHA
jgi:hypothetical protein